MAGRKRPPVDNDLVRHVAQQALEARDTNPSKAGSLARSASTLASLVSEADRDPVTAVLAALEER